MPTANFKSDDSFLQKLAVGAAGTKATIRRLTELGFRPIELERGSSGFKIWKRIKIKRVRVPDILCLKSGIRFESRGKTNLEISMSHSRSDPNRAWDSGLSAQDYVCVVLCEQASDAIVDWRPASPVHFIRVSGMQDAFSQGRVLITTPKGVEEGSEIRVIWPCAVAHARSHITEATDRSLVLQPQDGGRSQRCVLARRAVSLSPLLSVGQDVEKNQIVAAVVPVAVTLNCPDDVGENYFLGKLTSLTLSERYAAAKALRYRGFSVATDALRTRVSDSAEDIYVRLEAAAALASRDLLEGWSFLEQSLSSNYEQVQLETVIVLSELTASARSQAMLIDTLKDHDKHEEIRAGAAWALGEFNTSESSKTLVSVFDEASLDVKTEAARSLLRIAPDHIPMLIDLIRRSPNEQRDGVAWVLARQGQFDPADLLADSPDENLRRWLAYILGYGRERFLEKAIDEVCRRDPQVYFSASVLWQLLKSWIYELKEY